MLDPLPSRWKLIRGYYLASPLFLILGWILLPIYSIGDLTGGGEAGIPYTPAEVLVNGGLAGGIFLFGFYQAQARILARPPFLGSSPRRD